MTNPYQTPESASLGIDLNNPMTSLTEVYRQKKLVVFSENSIWPKRCIKCNATTETTQKVKLSWVNPWYYLTIVFSFIVLLIVVLIAQKRFTIELPLCDIHSKKRKKSIIIRWALFSIFLINLFTAIALKIDPLIFLSLPLFFVLLFYMAITNFINIRKVKNGTIWLKGADQSFLNSLEEVL